MENPPFASCPEWQREHLFFNSGWMSFLKSTALTENKVPAMMIAIQMRMGRGYVAEGACQCFLEGECGFASWVSKGFSNHAMKTSASEPREACHLYWNVERSIQMERARKRRGGSG